jgi:hypothetical protein
MRGAPAGTSGFQAVIADEMDKRINREDRSIDSKDKIAYYRKERQRWIDKKARTNAAGWL